jgi:hypothetical protein
MHNFSEISDVTRLQVGDLIVVPSEVSSGANRLHLAVNTLSKLGISCGYTGRADNRPETVRDMLTKDTGHTRILFVNDVMSSDFDASSGLLQFTGNRIDEEPLLPKVRYCRFYPLPVGDDMSKYGQMFFLEHMHKNAVDVLFGNIKNSMFFVGENGPVIRGNRPVVRCGDRSSPMAARLAANACIVSAYNSEHSSDAGRPRNLAGFLPCTVSGVDLDADMPAVSIEEFLSMKPYRKEHFDGSGERYDHDVKVQCKFLVAYARRGAKFYRPSKAFLDTVAANVLAVVFKDYIENCGRVLEAVKYVEGGLKAGVAEVKSKIKQASALSTYLARRGSNKEIEKQLKELGI